jgi:undecaprenyl-diphosphatase
MFVAVPKGSRARHRVALATVVVGAVVLYDTVKFVVGRPRPPADVQLVITATGSAFPSGHATASAAAYGAIALVVWARWGARAGRGAMAAAVVITAVVGFSRVYLGVHWPTDVVAGWCAGAAWLWLVWWTVVTSRDRRRGAFRRGTVEDR